MLQTLASVILLASLAKTRQYYCHADKILQKTTAKNTHIYIYFKEVGQKVVIYDVMTIGFYPSSLTALGLGAEDIRLFLGGIRTIFY
jgi:hypothetical protein